ncbi:hypothetical protein [Streptomyces acidiscabies]|uniref:hypothetical protein n=1 Tax=Streptomyces acidiscabies TaxID=42234 RepID=UPI0002F8B305|nr:hypothetical protein [Streptomyces acidiscabies]MBZ3917729.1 hypothetical protein [Streptomyces acidiscabies]GAQ52620.1 hypothetical protein a10_02415 [Streptomyces acidiscabies]GAV39825.1 hypothetical protein Saa2_02712 [Streptomyces acidiscabies]
MSRIAGRFTGTISPTVGRVAHQSLTPRSHVLGIQVAPSPSTRTPDAYGTKFGGRASALAAGVLTSP